MKQRLKQAAVCTLCTLSLIAPAVSSSAAEIEIPLEIRKLRIGYIEQSFMEEEQADIGKTFIWMQRMLPQYRFEIRTYPVKDLEAAVKAGEVDFFLGGAGFYRRIQAHGLRDIATMTTARAPDPSNGVGTLLLVRKDSVYQKLTDLKNARAAVNFPEGFSESYVPRAEIAYLGHDADSYFRLVPAGSPMKKLLLAVNEGKADVAFARACTFEMLQEAEPEFASQFRPVHLQKTPPGFRCLSSTRLYPSWTFVSTKEAGWKASRDVTTALLAMPATERGTAWGVVSDFAAVDDLYRVLKAGPYSYLRIQSVSDFVQRYKAPIGFALMALLGLLLHSWRSSRLLDRRTRELRASMEKEREAENRIKDTEDQLKTFERISTVGAMSGLIAHELNGPLSVISNSCAALERVLERCDAPAAAMKTAELIEKQCVRCAEIVKKVRSYAKNREKPLVSVSLTDTAGKALALRTAASPRVKFSWNRPEEKHPVLWDPLECELAVNNLLKNAAESCLQTADHPEVTLAFEETGDRVALVIRDNGVVTGEELAEHTAPLHSGKSGGLGLGLFIIRTLAEKVSGRIEITRENHFTAARLILPKLKDSADKGETERHV